MVVSSSVVYRFTGPPPLREQRKTRSTYLRRSHRRHRIGWVTTTNMAKVVRQIDRTWTRTAGTPPPHTIIIHLSCLRAGRAYPVAAIASLAGRGEKEENNNNNNEILRDRDYPGPFCDPNPPWRSHKREAVQNTPRRGGDTAVRRGANCEQKCLSRSEWNGSRRAIVIEVW